MIESSFFQKDFLKERRTMHNGYLGPRLRNNLNNNMRDYFLLLPLIFAMGWVYGQELEVEIDLTANEVLSQGQTGTCWSFSTTSFLESEVFRISGELVDLSEMAPVRVIYPEKAERFTRYQGKHQFGPGGLAHDVIHAANVFGLVPQSVYPGGQNPEAYDHGELDTALEEMVRSAVKQAGSISTESYDSIANTLDTYLGPLPTSFESNGEVFTPIEWRDALGIVPEDYISLTSFTHHPFGEEFILEVPDNHSHEMFLNVPLDDLERAVNNALSNGYTVAWDADVSNEGFSFSKGWAVMPETVGLGEEWNSLDAMPDEPATDQASRQRDFDSQSTTDDHLMHIVGRAKDSKNRSYFIIKNSWGDNNAFGGRQFVSMDYFRHFTIGILLHSAALPLSVVAMINDGERNERSRSVGNERRGGGDRLERGSDADRRERDNRRMNGAEERNERLQNMLQGRYQRRNQESENDSENDLREN
jgi:bleomycin hydrolase